jgi:Domain of unknown function (DUF4129)
MSTMHTLRLLLCLCGLLAAHAAWGQTPQAAAAASAPSREQVDEAATSLRSLPGLNDTRMVRSLRFKFERDPAQPPTTDTPDWLRWLADFVQWFNDAGRWLVWLLIAGALAIALLRLRRWLGGSDRALNDATLKLPTQVRGLDISPESLPADVGAAAWALWQQGQQLAALSLLYRGALSQLVHGHAVPIRASSTEGDCLQLAAPRLAEQPRGYLQTLVAVWGQAVYASRWPSNEQVRPLCDGFVQLKPGPAP